VDTILNQKLLKDAILKELGILFEIYLPIVDGALIFDNSNGKHELLAEKTIDGQLTVIDSIKFNELRKYL
jgi:predicted ABC-type ATPase